MRTRSLAIPGLLLATLTMGGCYEHVVGVRGPASQNYNVQEANIGANDSVWSEPSARPVEENRYSSTTLDRAKPVPTKSKQKSTAE